MSTNGLAAACAAALQRPEALAALAAVLAPHISGAGAKPTRGTRQRAAPPPPPPTAEESADGLSVYVLT